jgi:hypothetical protein
VMMAAARYFCMFLAKAGLLPSVYKALRGDADASQNVSVEAVLTRVAGQPLKQLETRWSADIQSRDLGQLDTRWRELREPIRLYVSQLPPLD